MPAQHRSDLSNNLRPTALIFLKGEGAWSIFGVPFLAAGVFTALIGAQIIPVSNKDEVPAWA